MLLTCHLRLIEDKYLLKMKEKQVQKSLHQFAEELQKEGVHASVCTRIK